MIEPYRRDFNTRQFSLERYRELLARLNARTRTTVGFRVCETPCFFSRAQMNEMAEIGQQLTAQLLASSAYLQQADAAIPPTFRVPGEDAHPHFMTADFGFARDGAGPLVPKLVELQAFPSIFGYQDVLNEEYRSVYGLDPALDSYLGGLDSSRYWELLRRTIVGEHAAENVVLLEVEPEQQKTLPDFRVYEQRLGIRTVDIATVRKVGRRLLYDRDGRWTPIERIFNRAIVDDLTAKAVTLPFDYRDDLEVEWAGHPNWFFRISKLSLPYLEHSSVPTAVFLDRWMNGERGRLPEDRAQLLLKPLYSFAGKGIQFAPTDADLLAVPPADRHLYLLQERVPFEPVIETPHGLTQAEVRILYLWPDGAPAMTPAMSLVRLGRGLMMGVDHNRNQEWVGGSGALLAPGPI